MSTKDSHSLEAILEAISRIRRFTEKHPDQDSFYSDDIAFDAVMMNFIVIGEMVTKDKWWIKSGQPTNWMEPDQGI